MSDRYRVILAIRGLSNLIEIANYIQKDSPQNAQEIAERVLNAIDSLSTMPSRFRCVGKFGTSKMPVHAMTEFPFNIYYYINAKTKSVHIIHIVRGAKRQPYWPN